MIFVKGMICFNRQSHEDHQGSLATLSTQGELGILEMKNAGE
jgi:hypothetical protein